MPVMQYTMPKAVTQSPPTTKPTPKPSISMSTVTSSDNCASSKDKNHPVATYKNTHISCKDKLQDGKCQVDVGSND
jgi:hypothetical protein